MVGPGEALFIPRRTVHGFRNDGSTPASCLCILTPGMLGSDYFSEMAALAAVGADLSAMKDVMLRHGLVPAPQA